MLQRCRPSRDAVWLLLSSVVLWLTLRSWVDVQVSVAWRRDSTPLGRRPHAEHCSDSCFKARDGICDEGRQPSAARAQGLPSGVSAVSCDLGTDCSDCGPWAGPQAHPSWSEPLLPIAFLRAANISVRSRAVSNTTAPPLAGLRFAFVDPALDLDVSKHMQAEGAVEVGITQVLLRVLAQRCSSRGRSGRSGLFADVGANFGWHSCVAAFLGCEVVAWEPVPAFRALAAFNLAANRLTAGVTLRAAVVASPPGSKQTVVVPNRGIWGSAGISGANVDPAIANAGPYQKVEVVAESLDEVLRGRSVALLKVDVEGYEPSVMATAQQLLASGRIDNVVLEYTPGTFERAGRWADMARPPQMLLSLIRAGFTLLWLPDDFVRVWHEGRSVSDPLPQLRAITEANLAYDLWDARMYRTGKLDSAATPFCEDMTKLGLGIQGIPERLHPKSLHSEFSHNTNLAAIRDKQLLSDARLVGPPVGIVPLAVPTNASWFPPPTSAAGAGGQAMGGISCEVLAADARHLATATPRPPQQALDTALAVLIGRRCRCPHDLPCQAHEEAAERCTRAGQTPFVDLQPP